VAALAGCSADGGADPHFDLAVSTTDQGLTDSGVLDAAMVVDLLPADLQHTADAAMGDGGVSNGCPLCPSPAAGKVCVTGRLFDFVTNAPLSAGQKTIRVSLHDAVSFAVNTTGTPIAEASSDKGCFTFDNLTPTSSGLLVLAAGDPTSGAQQLQLAYSVVPVVADQVFVADLYTLPKSVVASWSTAASADYASSGAYVAFFVDAQVPQVTNNTMPTASFLAGVSLQNTAGLGAAKYLGATRNTFDTALTATGPLGGVVAASGNLLGTVSGQNGTCMNGGTSHACKWETHVAGLGAGAILIDRLFDCTATPTTPSCQ